MNAPTSPDNRVWFELYAVEVEIGQPQLIQLPEPQPDCLGPFELTDSHPHHRNNARGAPVKTVIAVFTRPVVAGASAPRVQTPPPQPRVAAPPQRQQQPAQQRPAAPARAAAAVVAGVVDGLQQLASDVVAGVARTVVPIAERAAEAAGVPTAPAASASASAGGELSCRCPSPQPAANNGAAAVPCLGCGGWIQMEPESVTAEPEAPTPELPRRAEQQQQPRA